jgi:hypothetical protein
MREEDLSLSSSCNLICFFCSHQRLAFLSSYPKVCGSMNVCLVVPGKFRKVLALLRIKILCRFCVLVYKETCLFLVSYKPIHTDFSKRRGGRSSLCFNGL